MNSLKSLQRNMRSIPALAIPLRIGETSFRFGKSILNPFRSQKTSYGFDLIQEGNVVVDVHDFGGIFELDARSHLFRRIMLNGSFEPESAAAVVRHLRRSGDCLDVGANSGFFSVLFSRLIDPDRRILALEPTAAALRFLRANLERNGAAERTIVFEGAAGDTTGHLELEVIIGKEEYSSVKVAHPSVNQSEKNRTTVAMETIDNLVVEHGLQPSFIKIDIEGSEMRALAGAKDTLNRYRPDLLLEFAPALLKAAGSSGDELLEFLRLHQYEVEWLTDCEIFASPMKSHPTSNERSPSEV